MSHSPLSPALAEHVAQLILATSRARRFGADAELAGQYDRALRAYRLSRRFWRRAQRAAGVLTDWRPGGTGCS